MNELQTDRWDRLIRKLGDIRGGVVAPSVSPELVPILAVEPEDRPENEYLRDNRLYWHRQLVAAVAGQFGQVSIRNGSTDRLVIIESVRSDANILVALDAITAGGTVGTPQGRDSRYVGVLPGAELLVGATAIVMAGPQWPIIANVLEPLAIILHPGHNCTFGHTTVNTAFNFAIQWRERGFTPTEL